MVRMPFKRATRLNIAACATVQGVGGIPAGEKEHMQFLRQVLQHPGHDFIYGLDQYLLKMTSRHSVRDLPTFPDTEETKTGFRGQGV